MLLYAKNLLYFMVIAHSLLPYAKWVFIYCILWLRIRQHSCVLGTNLSVGGREVTEAIMAIFAALIWHTQSLREEIDAYGNCVYRKIAYVPVLIYCAA